MAASTQEALSAQFPVCYLRNLCIASAPHGVTANVIRHRQERIVPFSWPKRADER